MKILGIDPSLSNFGFALMDYSSDTLSLHATRLSETKPKDKKDRSCRQNEWDLGRCVLHHHAIKEIMRFKPDYVAVELPVGSKSARAMASYGAVIGIIAHMRAYGVTVLIVTPEQVKLAAVANKEASKKEMILWATSIYGTEHFLKGPKGVVLNKNEHIADAIAAVHAALPQIHARENEKVAA